MKISHRWTYPATASRVWTMMTDTVFQDAKCAGTHPLAYRTTVTPHGAGAQITTSRSMPTDQLPAQVARFLKDGLTIVETQTWQEPATDGARSGTVEVTVPGAPISMKGQVQLRPVGSTTEMTLEADLVCSIPLVGGQVERSAEPAITAALRVEQSEGRRYLQQNPAPTSAAPSA